MRQLLEEVQSGRLSVKNGLEQLGGLPFLDLGHTRVDTQRELRCGFPEVIFCPGKTSEQIGESIKRVSDMSDHVLNGMQSIKDATHEVSEVLQSLHAKSRDISAITQLINNHAENNTRWGDEVNLCYRLIGKIEER